LDDALAVGVVVAVPLPAPVEVLAAMVLGAWVVLLVLAVWPAAIHPASARTVSELAAPVIALARLAGWRRRRRSPVAAGPASRLLERR
jgi:hypothetical protein